MRFSIIKIVFLKELREMLRDRPSLHRSRTSSMYVEPRINKILNNYEHGVLEQRLKDRGQPPELLQPLKRSTADIATADQRLGKLLAMSLPVLLLVTGMLGALFP